MVHVGFWQLGLHCVTAKSNSYLSTCSFANILTHARIQDFLPGGGGSRAGCQKTALTIFFYYTTYFTVLQRVSNGHFKENYNFPRFQGVQHFPGGGGGGGSKS